MPGRHRQQVRTRYQRTLDENVRHGALTDHETWLVWPMQRAVCWLQSLMYDRASRLILGGVMCWTSVPILPVTGHLKKMNVWFWAVQVFGRGQWIKIAEILPRHSPASISHRYSSLLSAKMRVSQLLPLTNVKVRLCKSMNFVDSLCVHFIRPWL
ncbi:hypothetical protein COOONC_26718 [Cooperia oncophora]